MKHLGVECWVPRLMLDWKVLFFRQVIWFVGTMWLAILIMSLAFSGCCKELGS